MNGLIRLSLVCLLFTFSHFGFAEGPTTAASAGGNVCKGGGVGKCHQMCQDMISALKSQCLQEVLGKFKDLLQQGAIQGEESEKWCSNEQGANYESVAVGLVAGVAIGESDCSPTVPGPSAGVNGEKPEGYCQLNASSVKPYPCCGDVDQLTLITNGKKEAECGMGEVLQNVTKDKVWAEGETGHGARGAAAFNQSCANSKPFLKDKAIASVSDACQSGNQPDYLGPIDSTR